MLYVDLETYSATDLKAVGAYRYSEDPTTELLMGAWAHDDDPVELAVGEEQIRAIPGLWDRSVQKVAQNAAFERLMLGLLAPTYVEDWEDTMVMAAAAGLPKDLARMAVALGGERKDEAGTRLINLFSKPRRVYPHQKPVEWAEFCRYCVQDVVTLRDVHRKLPALLDAEDELWRVDQRINDRGIRVDLELAEAAAAAGAVNQGRAKLELAKLTRLANPNSPPQIKGWLEGRGLVLPKRQRKTKAGTKLTTSLDAEAVEELLLEDLEPDVRRVLELRQETALSSGAKHQAAVSMASEDGRLRGQFNFYGAHTGRWSGRGVQLQNLPRATVKDPETAALDLTLGLGAESTTLKALVRHLLVGPFVVCDYSAIEARVLAWLAGERWALDAFLDQRDIYVETAERMTVAGRQHNADAKELTRAQGKVAVLALGYQGGIRSLRAMGATGSDAELQPLVYQWRDANRRIVSFWATLELAFRQGGKAGRHLEVRKVGRDRELLLPSGRTLVYRKIQTTVDEQGRSQVSFWDARGWRQGTYGGRLTENVTQAVARDLLAHALLLLDAEGLPVVGHVHDEVVVEGTDLEPVERLMTQVPEWATGLPLDAAGFVTERYRKG